ncbi:MAG: hypothetical protein ACKVQK_02810, partial [Burkholderiales bacterium]
INSHLQGTLATRRALENLRDNQHCDQRHYLRRERDAIGTFAVHQELPETKTGNQKQRDRGQQEKAPLLL